MNGACVLKFDATWLADRVAGGIMAYAADSWFRRGFPMCGLLLASACSEPEPWTHASEAAVGAADADVADSEASPPEDAEPSRDAETPQMDAEGPLEDAGPDAIQPASDASSVTDASVPADGGDAAADSGQPAHPWWGEGSDSADFVPWHCGLSTPDNTLGRFLTSPTVNGAYALVSEGDVSLIVSPGWGGFSWIDTARAAVTYEQDPNRAARDAAGGVRFVSVFEDHLEFRDLRDRSLLASIRTGSDRGAGIAQDGSYVWAAADDGEKLLIKAWNEAGREIASSRMDYRSDIGYGAMIAKPNRLIVGPLRIPIPQTSAVEVGPWPDPANLMEHWFQDGEHMLVRDDTTTPPGPWTIQSVSGQVVATLSITDVLADYVEGSGAYYWHPNILEIYAIASPGLLLRQVPHWTYMWTSSGPSVETPTGPTGTPDGGRFLWRDGDKVRWVDLSDPTLPLHEYDLSSVSEFGSGTPQPLIDSATDDGRDWVAQVTGGAGSYNTRHRIEAGLPNLGCGGFWLAGSASGRFALAARGGVALFDAATAPPTFLGSYVGMRRPVKVQLTDDGTIIAIDEAQPSGERVTRLVEFPTGRLLGSWPNRGFQLANSGGRMAINSGLMWSLVSLAGETLWTATEPQSDVMTLSPSGKYMAFASSLSATDNVRILDGAQRQTIAGGFRGWVDDERFVLNEYQQAGPPSPAAFRASSVYDLRDGSRTPSPAPQLFEVKPFAANQVLSLAGITDLVTGQQVWTPTLRASASIRYDQLVRAAGKVVFMGDLRDVYVQSR
jgi:hypothetical protein